MIRINIFKINSLLSKTQKFKLIFLLISLIFGAVLEVFGIGILIPLISLILDPEALNENLIIRNIYSYLQFNSYKYFILSFLFFVTLLYLLKTFYLIYFSYRQNRFIANFIAKISNKLFSKYMYAPYNFHLSNHSSGLIKNIQVEVHSFWNLCISLMTFYVDFVLLISIIITLLFIEPTGALTTGSFFGIISLIFYQLIKKKIKFWGEKREFLDNQNSKIIQEGFGGIKDIIVTGSQSFFIKNFNNNNFFKARLWSKNATISQLPRFFLEMLSLVGLIGFIIIMLLQEKDVNTLITTLGVFVAATFKIIPSLNRILAASQTIRFYNSSINIIYEELNDFNLLQQKREKSKLKLKSKLKFNNVSFSFKGVNENVIKNLNFEIKKGETIGIIGNSGSGKSTLVDLIIGLHKPISGTIYIDKKKLNNNLRKWQNNIGYVPQNIFLLDDTIQANIAFGIPEEKIDKKQILNVIYLSQLEKFVKSLDKGINTKVGERGVQMSGGERQRLGIARALYHNPEILILDEATSALDKKTELQVMKSINKLKGEKTILIIAHRLSTLEKTDKIFLLDRGKLNERKIFDYRNI